MLPEGTIVFDTADRDEDGYYVILPGHSHVFPFMIPPLSKIEIGMNHHYIGGQDLSLRCSITTAPLDSFAFPMLDHYDTFSMTRITRTLEIWDNALLPRDDARVGYSVNRPLYFNVVNLQNAQNAYKLTFSH